ncbi:MAG: ABC transporter permease subunit [Planctomycetota bacterium]
MHLPGFLTPFRNPIFEREFVALCRTKRWFFLRTLLVTFLTAATWFVLASEISRADRLDVIGRALFLTGTVVQVGFVFLLASGLCSDLIVSERRRESLDIILTTPLSASSIVLGKLFSRLGLIVVMVASSFPLISVSLLYGGVSGRQVVGLFEITMGTILLTAGPALIVSTFARRLGTAAVLSQLIPIAWCMASPFLFRIFVGWNGVAELTVLTNPLMAALELSETVSFLKRRHGIDPSTGYLAFGACVAAGGVILSVLRLRRERSGDAAGGRRKRRKNGNTPPLAGTRRSRIARGPMRNPVLWKEINLINASTSRALFWIMAILLLGAEALLLLTVRPEYLVEEPGIHTTFACGAAFVLLLVTIVNAATAIVSEREQGTLELLHVTPISIRQILEGKAAGVIRSMALLALVPILHLVFAAFLTQFSPVALVGFLATFGVVTVAFTVAGLRHSILADRPGRAILRSLLHFAIVMLGYPVALGLVRVFGVGGADDVFQGLLMFHPMGLIGAGTMLLQEPDRHLVDLVPWLVVSFLTWAGVTFFLFHRMILVYRTRILGRLPRRRTAGRVQ